MKLILADGSGGRTTLVNRMKYKIKQPVESKL